MNAQQNQAAADHWIRPHSLGRKSTRQLLVSTPAITISLLFRPKADRLATDLENLEYLGISLYMENSGNSVQKIVTNKVFLVRHSNICVKQLLTCNIAGVDVEWPLMVIITFTFCCDKFMAVEKPQNSEFFLLLCGHPGWYSFYCPMVGRRLSRPSTAVRLCSQCRRLHIIVAVLINMSVCPSRHTSCLHLILLRKTQTNNSQK